MAVSWITERWSMFDDKDATGASEIEERICE
jgi:hypothetical protein